MRSESENELQHILIKCITACEVCATECLSEPDVKAMEACIRTDRDCADVCALLSRFVARQSRYTKGILKKCIKICKACEDECRKHQSWHCQKCAEICHECHMKCESFLKENFAEAQA